MHVGRCKVFAGQVRNPFTELIVPCRDKAAPLAVEGIPYGEIGVEPVTLFGEVWGL